MHNIHIKKSAVLSKQPPLMKITIIIISASYVAGKFILFIRDVTYPNNNTAYFKTYWQPIFRFLKPQDLCVVFLGITLNM